MAGWQLDGTWSAPGQHLDSAWLAAGWQLVCTWTAPGWQLVGSWSAPGQRLVGSWLAAGLHDVVEWVSREKVGLVRSNPQTPNPLKNSVKSDSAHGAEIESFIMFFVQFPVLDLGLDCCGSQPLQLC